MTKVGERQLGRSGLTETKLGGRQKPGGLKPRLNPGHDQPLEDLGQVIDKRDGTLISRVTTVSLSLIEWNNTETRSTAGKFW